MNKHTPKTIEIGVIDLDGNAINNASISIKNASKSARSRPAQVKFNKRQNNYALTKFKPGRYAVEVKAQGFETQVREVNISSKGAAVQFTLGIKGLPFYYRQNEQILFRPRKDLIAATLAADATGDDKFIDKIAKKLKITHLGLGGPIHDDNIRVFKVSDKLTETELQAIQAALLQVEGIRMVGPVLHLDEERVSYLTSEYIARFVTRVKPIEVDRIIKKFSLQVVRRIPYVPNGYLLRSLKGASLNSLELVNDLAKSDLVEYVEPNLVQSTVDFAINPTDFLYAQQWHIPLANLPGAWQALRDDNPVGVMPGDAGDLTFGSEEVVIAVLDRGIQSQTVGAVTSPAHPDFTGTITGGANKMYRYFDFANMVENNDAPPNDHGMGCAGVATSVANNPSVVVGEIEGSVGAAPNCRAMGLIRPAGGTLQQYADAYAWIAGFDPGWVADGTNYPVGTTFPAIAAPGADVISNSFLIPTGGLMNDTFDFIATYGRLGKGIPNFCAAGNSNINVTTNNPMAAHEKAITMAASTDGDVKSGYSAFGNAIDLCAPSSGGAQGIFTCDLLNSGNIVGHTGGNLDYRNNFGGTSSATPLAAGIAALMISINPSLTWIQVREILHNTADKIDFANADPVGQWIDTTGDAVNNFSQWYGWGRVDAEAAVIGARDLGLAADIVVRDNLGDDGSVPSAGWHANSPDIWTSPSNDPIPVLAYGATPPHLNPIRDQDNYVYLRVKNVGTASSNEAYIRALICHYPGFEFRYPDEWLPSSPPSSPVPAPLAPGTYLIGEELVDDLAAGSDTIVKITWDAALVPPTEVMVDAMLVTWHPCLLADVSPHDGPAPAGATIDVKRDNNLAHKNISIDDSDASDFNRAYGVIAGTSAAVGVRTLLVDRSMLPGDFRVFFRVADALIMQQWKKLVLSGKVTGVAALPGSTVIPAVPQPQDPHAEGHACGCPVTLLEDSRIAIDCCDDSKVIIEAKRGTTLNWYGCDDLDRSVPKVSLGKVQGQEVLFFDGGAAAIELPMLLAAGQYLPVILGAIRTDGRHSSSLLQATQRKGDGELSAGYSIEL
jgi:hypothetical protein